MVFLIRYYSSSIPRCSGRVNGILPLEHKEIGNTVRLRIQDTNSSPSAHTVAYPYIKACGSSVHVDEAIRSLDKGYTAKAPEGSCGYDGTCAHSDKGRSRPTGNGCAFELALEI